MAASGRAALVGLVLSLGGLASVTGVWLTGAGDDGHAAPTDAGSPVEVVVRQAAAGPASTRESVPAATTEPRSAARTPRPSVAARARTRVDHTPPPRPATERVAVASGVEVHDARVGAQAAERVRSPVRIRVPALDIDARIRPMGIKPTGEMELPVDPGSVGWYGYGPTPGEPGSSVLAGHVDGDGRRGAFYRLAELGPGGRVTVTAADGSSRSFRVTGRQVFAKARLPTASIFRRSGAPVLTLITCGGAFDRATGHYASNIVVVAAPV